MTDTKNRRERIQGVMDRPVEAADRIAELKQALRECYAAVDWTGCRENIRHIVSEALEDDDD